MIKKLLFGFLKKQYTSIGGQAVIEGVMMRSPNAFVVAVRTPEGKIRLRKDQWFGLSKKYDFLKKPFFRGVLTLLESMANGIVSLNYSANIAMSEELKKEALKKGKTLEEFEASQKKKEKIDYKTFFTILSSLLLGLVFFVGVPHLATAGIDKVFSLNWDLNGFWFHFVDGVIKAILFIGYIWAIGFIPDIRRVFQYHGAEHKSIATFEAGEELTVQNAKKYSTLHPRCGTSFLFFVLFVSIILFAVLFTIIPIGNNLPVILKHTLAILVKFIFMLPVAGISYEIIKFSGKHANNSFCRALSFPGMKLQLLTTREPDESQLEVALSSIKAVLELEEKYNLKDEKEKTFKLMEVDIDSLSDIQNSDKKLKDFLEL